jgi:hypothetical protein
MAKETDVDCMKYRKSTHIAGVDVEMMVAENGNCNLTIKEAYYNTGVNVSGKKTDGYFLEFIEAVKPMVANSGNRAKIAGNVKILTGCTSQESRNLKNWKGIKVELVFDPNVTMMNKITGGIVVVAISPIPKISDVNGLAVINSSKTLAELIANWDKLSAKEKALPTINSLKDKLKKELK